MATAPASTGAQHAVAAPAKTPIMYTPTTPLGSPPPTDGAWFHIQPRSVAAPTTSIITPPSRNIVSWLAEISWESPAAPAVSGQTTVATPTVKTAVRAAVRQRLAPVTLARYVGSITNAQQGAKKATMPARKAARAEPVRSAPPMAGLLKSMWRTCWSSLSEVVRLHASVGARGPGECAFRTREANDSEPEDQREG